MTATTTVTADLAVLERFYIEVLALSALERMRFGGDPYGQDTGYTNHICRVIGEFERASGLWDLDDDEEGVRLHDLAWARARAVHREILEEMLSEAAAGDAE